MSRWRRQARVQKRAMLDVYDRARADGTRTYVEVRKSLNALPLWRRVAAAVRLAWGRLP